MKKTIYAASFRMLVGKLKKARLDSNLTQAQSARLVGTSRSWIQKAESGQTVLDILQVQPAPHPRHNRTSHGLGQGRERGDLEPQRPRLMPTVR